jgi:hypothetical protein
VRFHNIGGRGPENWFAERSRLNNSFNFPISGGWNQRLCYYYTEKGMEALSISQFLEEYFQKTN